MAVLNVFSLGAPNNKVETAITLRFGITRNVCILVYKIAQFSHEKYATHSLGIA